MLKNNTTYSVLRMSGCIEIWPACWHRRRLSPSFADAVTAQSLTTSQTASLFTGSLSIMPRVWRKVD